MHADDRVCVGSDLIYRHRRKYTLVPVNDPEKRLRSTTIARDDNRMGPRRRLGDVELLKKYSSQGKMPRANYGGRYAIENFRLFKSQQLNFLFVEYLSPQTVEVTRKKIAGLPGTVFEEEVAVIMSTVDKS